MQPINTSKPKILIAETEPSIRVILKVMMRSLGILEDDWLLTESPEDFLRMFYRYRPYTLLIISSNMPKAMQLLEEIRFLTIEDILVIHNKEEEKNVAKAYNCLTTDRVDGRYLLEILKPYADKISDEKSGKVN
jgi:DNA-binding response OmpR family regulator